MSSEGLKSERSGPSGAQWAVPDEAMQAFAPFCDSLSDLFWSYRADLPSIRGTRKQEEDEKEGCVREEACSEENQKRMRE